MPVISIHDRAELARRLRQDADLHLYELGDLDDFFWPQTTWYGTEDGNAVVLVYGGSNPPTVLALSRPDGDAELCELVAETLPLLPGSSTRTPPAGSRRCSRTATGRTAAPAAIT